MFKDLQAGDIDAYADYSGTITQELLKGESVRDDEQMRQGLERFGIGMSDRLGFNKTYAIGNCRAACLRTDRTPLRSQGPALEITRS